MLTPSCTIKIKDGKITFVLNNGIGVFTVNIATKGALISIMDGWTTWIKNLQPWPDIKIWRRRY
jgi:hypothetical protein